LSEKERGKIYVIGTPIGNLSDITIRALETLKKVDIVVAEDTRRTLKLLSYYQIRKPLISYHKFNERKRAVELLRMLKSGRNIGVVSDAGMPGISDPGKELISKAWDAGIDVVVIPGVSAVTAALSISGFETTPFAFFGFPPSKGKDRRRFFEKLSGEELTIVIFESPKRFRKTLRDLQKHLGNRHILVARELTKIHEEIFRGSLEEAIDKWLGPVKGEITMIIEGKKKSLDESSDLKSALIHIREELNKLICSGMSTRDAVKEISIKYSLPRSDVYKEAVKIDRER